jgi:hypothetical protein
MKVFIFYSPLYICIVDLVLYFLYLISHSWKLIVDWLLLKIGEYYFGQDRIGELTSGQEGHADNGNHIVESPGSANMTNQIHNEFMVWYY